MTNINDWAGKAAKEIIATFLDGQVRVPYRARKRIAFIIESHIEPLMTLLRDAKREHQWDEEEKCDKLNKIDPAKKVCTCGADAWNARVEAALNPQNP